MVGLTTEHERIADADRPPLDRAGGNGAPPPGDDARAEVDLDDGDGRPPWWRRLVDAFTPQGRLQVLAGVAALCFLSGAVGYLVGTRSGFRSTDVDTGFLVDMSTHHDQAVSMALCAVDRATDPVVRGSAREVLVFQNRELGTMGVWLDERHGVRPDDPDHPAMAWMGTPTTAAAMPGMASADEIDALCSARGPDVDHRFLTLLRAHHRGGVHMAEYAGEHAASPGIAAFARALARNQRVEANEYTQMLRRLGFES
jgi:uncharacterized protein (DUF305 family)